MSLDDVKKFVIYTMTYRYIFKNRYLEVELEVEGVEIFGQNNDINYMWKRSIPILIPIVGSLNKS